MVDKLNAVARLLVFDAYYQWAVDKGLHLQPSPHSNAPTVFEIEAWAFIKEVWGHLARIKTWEQAKTEIDSKGFSLHEILFINRLELSKYNSLWRNYESK